MKYSLPKQGKARPAKRLSFDELELVHKTFDLTVGIDDSSSGENSSYPNLMKDELIGLIGLNLRA